MNKKSKGVTLTELMIAVAIMGILVSIVGTFLVNGLKFYRLTRAKGEIQRDARTNVDLINKSLRQGRASTITISRYDNTHPPCSKIEFTTIAGVRMRFYQYKNNFYMGRYDSTVPMWRDNKLATNLRNIFFSYPRLDDDSIISVSVCFERATYEGASKALQLSVEKVRIMN